MEITIDKDKRGNVIITKTRGYVVDTYHIYCASEEDTKEVMNMLIHDIFVNDEEQHQTSKIQTKSKLNERQVSQSKLKTQNKQNYN